MTSIRPSVTVRALASRGSVVNGRYVLTASHGQHGDVQFWQATDTRLDRPVALTVFTGNPAGDTADEALARALVQARHADTFANPAVAPMLDVLGPDDRVDLGTGVRAIVVARWISDDGLLDVVGRRPVPVGRTARLVRPLAAAVDQAHHSGLAAGIDCPQRIRRTEQGELVLAFPGPNPGMTAPEDVRGLGALLYLMLTTHWPDAGDVADRQTRLAHLPATLPRRLALVTTLSLAESSVGGIRTAGPLLAALDDAIALVPDEVSRPVVPTPRPEPVAAPVAEVPVPREPESQPESQPEPQPKPRPAHSAPPASVAPEPGPSRHRFRRGLVVLGVLVVIAVLATTRLFGLVGRPMAAAPPPAHTATHRLPPPPVTTTVVPPSETPPTPVAPSGVREYVVTGSPDNPGQIGRVVDGDPNTSWSTDQYRQQFPMYEPGIGIMATFAQPWHASQLTIDSPSAGTVVQVRAAPAPDAPLAATQVLATATLTAGSTTIPLPAGTVTSNLLVWITQLANGPGGYQTTIAEISYLPSA